MVFREGILFAGVVRDSLPDYTLRMPEEAVLQAYRDDPAFHYGVEAKTTDWWGRLLQWLSDHFPSLDFYIDDTWLWFVGWGLFILLLAFVVYKVVRGYYRSASLKREPQLAGLDALVGEPLGPLSHLQLVEQAEAKGDYALAVRIHYWYILHLLDKQELIRWDAHKTNFSYCDELKDEALRPGFRRLTHVFDCVCYGEFPIGRGLYEELQRNFAVFREKISMNPKKAGKR